MDELIALASQAWPYVVAGAPGIYLVWKDWKGERTASRKERADLVQIAQDAAEGVIKSLTAELARLQKKVAALEAEISSLRKEHADVIAQKDARITMLEGELRNARAERDAFERLLIRNGIEPPKSGRPYWELRDGNLEPIITGNS